MWSFFFNGQSWRNILRHILDYIRILARIRPKNRILTTPDVHDKPMHFPFIVVKRLSVPLIIGCEF